MTRIRETLGGAHSMTQGDYKERLLHKRGGKSVGITRGSSVCESAIFINLRDYSYSEKVKCPSLGEWSLFKEGW